MSGTIRSAGARCSNGRLRCRSGSALVWGLLFVAGWGSMAGAQHGVAGVPSVPPPFLVTSGQGESRITPDRASVMISVQTRAQSASAAGADNAQRTHAVQVALLRLGLPRDQLVTQGYALYPEMVYDPTGGTPRVAAYIVSNTVRAETHDPAQVGAIVDAALEAGANLISSLSFYASSTDEPRRQAIAMAVSNARADADAMARAAGGSLGGLLELTTQGSMIPPRPMFDVRMRGAPTAALDQTPVTPGPQTVTVHVNARWAFQPH